MWSLALVINLPIARELLGERRDVGSDGLRTASDLLVVLHLPSTICSELLSTSPLHEVIAESLEVGAEIDKTRIVVIADLDGRITRHGTSDTARDVLDDALLRVEGTEAGEHKVVDAESRAIVIDIRNFLHPGIVSLGPVGFLSILERPNHGNLVGLLLVAVGFGVDISIVHSRVSLAVLREAKVGIVHRDGVLETLVGTPQNELGVLKVALGLAVPDDALEVARTVLVVGDTVQGLALARIATLALDGLRSERLELDRDVIRLALAGLSIDRAEVLSGHTSSHHRSCGNNHELLHCLFFSFGLFLQARGLPFALRPELPG